MRVCNDDLVQPERGFGTHPHRDAEIATYIISGDLSHADSTGTSETLSDGSIQFMTAGRGVRHSERNAGKTPLRFIQMWFSPRTSSLPPAYGSYSAPSGPSVDAWTHLVGDVANSRAQPKVRLNADVNIYSAKISAGSSLGFELAAGRQLYTLALENGVRIAHGGGELVMVQHDAALLSGAQALTFAAPSDNFAHVLLVEMAA